MFRGGDSAETVPRYANLAFIIVYWRPILILMVLTSFSLYNSASTDEEAVALG